MDITWTVEVTPLVGALILIALILTVVFLIQQNYDMAAIVVSVLSIGLLLPLAPFILLGDTLFFALRQNRPLAIGCGVLAVIAFAVMLFL